MCAPVYFLSGFVFNTGTLAEMQLLTGRRIAVHPHYENKNLRQRVEQTCVAIVPHRVLLIHRVASRHVVCVARGVPEQEAA